MKQKKNRIFAKAKIKIVYLYYVIIILLLVLGITFSKYTITTSSETQIKASLFSFKVGETNEDVEIDLKDTVTNNVEGEEKSIIPGSEGKIDLEIDFSDMEVATNYTITVDTENTNIPSNIKLYTNSAHTVEFNGYSGISNLDTTKKTQTIYWKWNYTTEDETAKWMEQDIKLVLKINVEQRNI